MHRRAVNVYHKAASRTKRHAQPPTLPHSSQGHTHRRYILANASASDIAVSGRARTTAFVAAFVAAAFAGADGYAETLAAVRAVGLFAEQPPPLEIESPDGLLD